MDASTTPGLGHRLAALLLLLLAGSVLYLVVDQGLVGRYRYYQWALDQYQQRLAQLERMAATREPVQQLITTIQQDRGVTVQY